MLGVGTSIWNRALAGKGDGSGGNAPSGSYLFTESFTDAENDTGFTNTRATPQYVVTDTNALYPVPAGAIPIRGARPVLNLVASSDTPSTQNITVVVGHIYAVRIGDESASGATAVCSGAFTGTLTGDGVDSYALNGVATTTTLTVTITGSIRKLQVQDITHRAASSTAPDEYVDSATDHGTGVTGFRYFTTALANTVDGSGVVTEATGAALSGIALANVPGATNLHPNSADPTWINCHNSVLDITLGGVPSGKYDHVIPTVGVMLNNRNGNRSSQSAAATAGQYYCGSVYAKSGDYDQITLYFSGEAHGVHFNLTDGSVDSEYTAYPESYGSELLFDGWYRFWIATAADDATITFELSVGDSVDTTADGTSGIWVTGQQIETGTIPTPYIPTSGSTASTDAAVLDFSGVTGFTTPNETRVVATGLNASLEPDPTDTTERNVDVDDWDGTDLSDILPHANIKSVTVYAPGERP